MGLSCPDPERENHPALWGLPADRRQGRKGGGPGGLGSGQGLAGLRSAGGGRVTHVGQGHGHCWKNRFGVGFPVSPVLPAAQSRLGVEVCT